LNPGVLLYYLRNYLVMVRIKARRNLYLKGGHELKTILEDGDAEKCLQDIQCVSLGVEIAQLISNIERMPAR
jgi:hypothetical protein